MILPKLIISISLTVVASLAGFSSAFGETGSRNSQQNISTSLVPGLQYSDGQYGSLSSINLGNSWLNDKWSGKSSLYQSNTNSQQLGLDNTRHWSVDITRRLLSGTENTYIAMGLGWDDITLAEGESTSGMRLVAEGRVGVYGPAYLFGQAALSPWMREIDGHLNPTGKELELGLAVEPLPLMSLRAGYRSYWLNSVNSGEEDILQRQTDGFFIGGGLNW